MHEGPSPYCSLYITRRQTEILLALVTWAPQVPGIRKRDRDAISQRLQESLDRNRGDV
jgi:hypothetical protein